MGKQFFTTWPAWKIFTLIFVLLFVVTLVGFAFPTWYTLGSAAAASREESINGDLDA